MDWYFIPWSTQYIIGGIITLVICLYVLKKGIKARSHQWFFLFGLCVTVWLFAVFFARNAPSEHLSNEIYRIVGSSFMFIQPFLLITLLFIRKVRTIYLLTLAPVIAIALSILVLAPYEVVWTEYGWSYQLWPIMVSIGYPLVILYMLAIIVIGYSLIKSATTLLKKRYRVILFGVITYILLLTMTNFILFLSPKFPPFGGILALIEFLIIAYAISLPTEKIEVLPIKSIKKISKDYLRFLNKLLEVGPAGKEFGENLAKFKKYLPTLGLSDVIEFEREKISFRPEETKFDPGEVTDKTLDFMKQRGWTLSAVKPFTDVFVDTYEAMKSKSKKEADEWFERMLRKHGAFLYKHGILDAMPEGARIYGIFKELEVGKSYLVQEDRPKRCLEMLKEAVNYGFKGLCFTMRYPPQKIRNEYGLEGVDIIWLRLNPKKGVKTLAPDKLDELEKTISEFIAPGGAVVLVDAFDQIKVVNGFKKSMKFLQKMKVAAAESGANLLISMRPESVWEEESAAIAKITKPHQSGPTWKSFELL